MHISYFIYLTVLWIKYVLLKNLINDFYTKNIEMNRRPNNSRKKLCRTQLLNCNFTVTFLPNLWSFLKFFFIVPKYICCTFPIYFIVPWLKQTINPAVFCCGTCRVQFEWKAIKKKLWCIVQLYILLWKGNCILLVWPNLNILQKLERVSWISV